MAKVVVQHDVDPGIAIVLEEVVFGASSGRAPGWHGKCTECGRPMHRWDMAVAIGSAKEHVDTHESGL